MVARSGLWAEARYNVAYRGGGGGNAAHARDPTDLWCRLLVDAEARSRTLKNQLGEGVKQRGVLIAAWNMQILRQVIVMAAICEDCL